MEFVIKVGKDKVELTIDELMELKGVLDKLAPKENIIYVPLFPPHTPPPFDPYTPWYMTSVTENTTKEG